MVQLATLRMPRFLEAHRAPFPHWIVDRFITPEQFDAIEREWPEDGWHEERGSFQTKDNQPIRDGMARAILDDLESPQFCAWLSDITGIYGLQADRNQFGGGLHQSPRGGFLKMHTDFRYAPDGRRRALNLLIYLNRQWRQSWGGYLDLGKNRCKSIAPIAGRCVIFPTNRETWHGHPEPMTCPEHIQRRSMAVYYYTQERGVPDKTVYVK